MQIFDLCVNEFWFEADLLANIKNNKTKVFQKFYSAQLESVNSWTIQIHN